MSLSTDQQAELEKAATRAVYFVRFEFASGNQYLCTWNHTIPWDGHDWLGVGSLASVSAVQESDGLEPRALNFTMNVAQTAWLALAVGDAAEYRGLPAAMYMCPLDNSYQLVGTPEICWRGTMDMISTSFDGKRGSVTLKCETSSYGLKRRPSLRMNAAQQRQRHPTDSGFDYLVDLIANPQLWLSKKFQAI